MPDATPGHGAAEHGRDVVLHQEVGKALGAVSASEGDHISGPKREVPQAPRSDTGHRLALLPARS